MNLQQWLTHIESLHYSEIELGLERVTTVFKRLFLNGAPFEVITVGGTNGKGSCCAYLESIFHSNGETVGKFTSPHITHFNERIRINQVDVSDNDLCAAFATIEAVRGEISLTYFEYATLAAIQCFAQSKVNIGIFEVGLGGRLDAVNILNPQVSIITSIGLDHVDWLGDDVAIIGKEKAAIARKGQPCVIGEASPPKAMLSLLEDVGANIFRKNEHFNVDFDANTLPTNEWSISGYIDHLEKLAPNVSHQYSNAACAVVAVKQSSFEISNEAIRKGLKKTLIVGRCQIVAEQPITIMDVAHNYDSIAGLKEFSENLGYSGKCYAVFSMLADKDVAACIQELDAIIDYWHIAEIADVARATPLAELITAINTHSSATVNEYPSLKDAYNTVKSLANKDDCILIFGSFHVVGEVHDAILRI